MPLDFGKIAPPKAAVRHVDPIALFQSLHVTDPAINDLWLAQGDALRQWDSARAAADVAIVLNTGAGKTLVGLLAAHSLVNETHGHVVYACSSLQLVEQTGSKARGYGLDVTTYIGGAFSNDLYRQGAAPCLTTYQALFNGRSRFFREDLSAVVFDDAHTAGHLLRDQFTLRLSRDAFLDAFTRIVHLYRPYFDRIGKDTGYIETYEQLDSNTSWFIPPFAVKSHLAELQRILREASLREERETMFAWAYLRDHLDLCTIFVSGTGLSITPPVVPTATLPYFGDSVRRLYLSATLAAKDAFIRAFGREPDPVIAPTTTAGECERLILIPALGRASDGVANDTDAATRIVTDQKCLVLVPSRLRATVWDEIATIYDESVAEQVEDFKADRAPACLVLTARYDGVDLPGDTCRILVIDELPTGLNPLERYLWERLGLLKLLRSTIASRVTQSFGRISRGMSDHGVVILTGRNLVDWLLAPRHQALLPDFLQRQLQVGITLSRQLDTTDEFADATQQCLAHDPAWIEYYQRSMGEAEAVPTSVEDTEQTLQIARAERDFGLKLWERDYEGAAKSLGRGLEDTFAVSRAAGAWHALWLGYCYDLLGDAKSAAELYERAHRAESNIPPIDVGIRATADGYSPQALRVAPLLRSGGHDRLVLPKHLDMELAALDGAGTAAQVEAALEALGTYLGLETQRPDNEFGTGPDVLWSSSGGPALSLEAKTEKGEGSVYRKQDLGQIRDHRQWVREHANASDIYSAFVGPVVPASPGANPDPDTVVLELAVFRALRDQLRAALNDVCNSAVPATAPAIVQQIFDQRGLLWPRVYEEMPKRVLREVSPGT